MSFSELPLNSCIINALTKQFTNPTNIQSAAIEPIVQQRDVMALAQTGSGKTLAYGLGLLHHLQSKAYKQAIVIVPTRELATQVADELLPIASQLQYRVACVTGGDNIDHQVNLLQTNPAIIIATPGRLLALLAQNNINTTDIHAVVLDEMDRLLEMGFWPDIQAIMARFTKRKQTLLFSATMPSELEQKVNSLLCKPVLVTANPVNSVVEKIEEKLYLVNKGSKTKALIELIHQHKNQQILVFIGARDSADTLCKKLLKAEIKAGALHGNKEQTEREQTLQAFKQGDIQVLIATDVLARGIHIDALPVVINYELPMSAPVYVHRVGRTARAGDTGRALSLVCHGEMASLNAIRAFTNKELPLENLPGFVVTDTPSNGESKRPKRDKQANRRTNKKHKARQFKTKS